MSPIRPENKLRYPSNWTEISAQVRAESGGKCEMCGAKNGEAHPETGSKVVLTVAHLDHIPENCQRENLKALCQRCHNRHDAHHRRTNRQTNSYRDRERSGQTTIKGTGWSARRER